MKAAPAVAILINSPGGSAVQSHLIYKRIRALAAEKKKTVIVAVEDVAASGGYMIALAGDEIVVDASSHRRVDRRGASPGFGFQRLIEKVGIERRVHTAGEAKVILDPFQPEKEEDVARLKSAPARGPRLLHRPGQVAADAARRRPGDLHRRVLVGASAVRARPRRPGRRSRRWWSARSSGTRSRLQDDRRREGVPPPAARALARRRQPDRARWPTAALGVVEERLLWNRFGL